jgi:Ca-activated chloride channel family protein
MNPCKFNTYLTAYVLRDMDQKRLDALDAHLKSCPECQKQVAALRDTLSLLKEAFPTEKAQTGKAPVLDPERRQQLLTIKAVPKQSAFMSFVDKAYRPLRMIAATLLCVFGMLVILTAALRPVGRSLVGMFSTAGKGATGDSWGGGGGGAGVISSLGAEGVKSDSAEYTIKNELSETATDALKSELRDSDKRMDAPAGRESGERVQAGQKLGEDAGWLDKREDTSVRGKAKHRERYDDGLEANQPVSAPEPAAPPAPIDPQPAAMDAVLITKSPVILKNINGSTHAFTSADMQPRGRKTSQPEGAVAAAPAETVARPPAPTAAPVAKQAARTPAPATPMPTAERVVRDKEISRQLEPLKIQAAKPAFTGTPKDIRSANLEKTGERDNKPADYPIVSYERGAESKKELTLSGGHVYAGVATATSGSRLEIQKELKKSKTEEADGKFAYSDVAVAKDELRVSDEALEGNQRLQKKLEDFKEPADVSRKPTPPREPLPFNSFVAAATEPFSTFAMDVDTASYTLTRQALRSGKLPDPERVRLEEIVNAFDYDDTAPDRATFRVYQDGSQSPFGSGSSLLRIGVKGRRLGREEQRPAMLTFVIDVSGSMSQPDRIGYARQALSLLLDQVGTGDRIQIIAYSDKAQFVVPPSPASEKARIMEAFNRLQCNGSTNLEEGLRRAYEQAVQAFIPGAENRVILISDGVANLGADSAQEILDKVAANRKQGITCSVFGVGSGTYNDKMLEDLANKGDGVYRFLDSADAVKTAFVDDLAATLNTIAKDAKIQVEWNPKMVRRYRQLGYENRKLTKEQFRDDTVDAGEVGSGQSVTALYELELMPDVGPEAVLGTVRIRYQRTDTGKVEEIESPLVAATVLRPAHQASAHLKVAASAAEFAELLRGSPNAQNGRFDKVADYLRPAALELTLDTRVKELLELVTTAASLTK